MKSQRETPKMKLGFSSQPTHVPATLSRSSHHSRRKPKIFTLFPPAMYGRAFKISVLVWGESS
jgi:hypothetical protein